MPVLSVDVPAARVGVLNHQATLFGVTNEGIVAEEDGIYTVDLCGDARRMIQVALRAGGKPVHMEDNIEHGEYVKVYPDTRARIGG